MLAKKNVLFMLSFQPDPLVIKRINFFAQKASVDLLHFSREGLKDSQQAYAHAIRDHLSLGGMSDGQYVKRLWTCVKQYKKIKKYLSDRSYDYVVCNHCDMLLLYLLAKPNNDHPKVIMDISDLRAHCYEPGLKNMLMRKLEAHLFKKVDFLTLTSQKFYDAYYHSLYKPEPFILENKPLSNMVPDRDAASISHSPKITIGIVGLLLQKEPYRALFEAVKDNDQIDVVIHGMGKYQQFCEDYASRCNNICYCGPFDFFKDAARIYGSIDCLFMAYDTENGSLNNKVALPNKLYEAMYFQVPVITSQGAYVAEIVEQYHMGFLVPARDKQFLQELFNDNFAEKLSLIKKQLPNIPEQRYLGDKDYESYGKWLGLEST